MYTDISDFHSLHLIPSRLLRSLAN